MELIIYILFAVLSLILLAGAVITLLENIRHAKRIKSLDNEYAKLIADFAKTTENLDQLFIERSVTFEQNVAEMEKFMQAEYKSFLENIRVTKQQTKEQSTISQMHIMDLPKIHTPIEKKRYTPVEELQMSNRTTNALIVHGIGSIQELLKYSENHLSVLTRFGKKTVEEIKEALATRDLSLTPEKYE